MTQSITALLLSALVALNLQALLSMAVPLNQKFPARDLTWVTTTSVNIVEATVTDVITTFFSPDAAVSRTTTSKPTSTVTRWDTMTVTEPSNPTPTPSGDKVPQSWALPETFTDLSPFGINKLAYGSKNIAIVTGIPASASATGISSTPSTSTGSATSPTPSSSTTAQLPRTWTNTSSAYRILYPSGSINPGSRPQGGSDFYATPGQLPFKSAQNVTLEYSIFFPVDFQWVQGGKLPGIYGGHEGCSGGNDAKSCFSTRLMWRKGGAGELYLYAPKDKQTSELCSAPPQSVCDADYGLSVGRGSFHFAAGGWTHVSQTVRLNTPGRQDGGFELIVNGQRVMRRDDVFYRDVPSNSSGEDDNGAENDHPTNDLMRRSSQSSLNVGSIFLPPLLPVISEMGVLGGAVSGQEVRLFAPEAVLSQAPEIQAAGSTTIISHVSQSVIAPATSTIDAPNTNGVETITLTATVTSIQTGIAPSASAASVQVGTASQGEETHAVGFSGLFFSTFFGGHDKSWASPKDQYTWFKDFGMSINE